MTKFRNTEAAIAFYEEQIKLMETVHEEEMKNVEREAVGFINERVQGLLKLKSKFDEQYQMYLELRDRAANQLEKGYQKEMEGLKIDLAHRQFVKHVDEERRESNEKIADLQQASNSAVEDAKRYPTLREYFEREYLLEKDLKDDARRHMVRYIETFIKIAGDKRLSEYKRRHILEYVRVLECFPTSYGKSPKDNDRSVQEVLALALEEEKPTMSATTLRKHLSNVKTFFEKAFISYEIDVNKVFNLFTHIEFSRHVPGAKKRISWTIEQLNDLFDSPQWTGTSSKGQNKRYLEGKEIYKDSYWWLPVLSIYTGARLEELAQLEHSDLCYTDAGTAYLKVHDEGDRRVKTNASIRNIPIHDDLIELDFLKLFKKSKKGKIFSDLTPSGRLQKYGDTYSGHFTTYRRKCGLYEEMRDFHSLRRTFISTMRNKTDVEFLTIAAISGHDREYAIAKIQTEAYTDYDIDDLAKALSNLDYKAIGLKIDHLKE